MKKIQEFIQKFGLYIALALSIVNLAAFFYQKRIEDNNMKASVLYINALVAGTYPTIIDINSKKPISAIAASITALNELDKRLKKLESANQTFPQPQK